MLRITVSKDHYKVERIGSRGKNKLIKGIGQKKCQKINNQEYTSIKEMLDELYTDAFAESYPGGYELSEAEIKEYASMNDEEYDSEDDFGYDSDEKNLTRKRSESPSRLKVATDSDAPMDDEAIDSDASTVNLDDDDDQEKEGEATAPEMTKLETQTMFLKAIDAQARRIAEGIVGETGNLKQFKTAALTQDLTGLRRSITAFERANNIRLTQNRREFNKLLKAGYKKTKTRANDDGYKVFFPEHEQRRKHEQLRKEEFIRYMMDPRGWTGQGYRIREAIVEGEANVTVHFRTTEQLEKLYGHVPNFETEFKGLSLTDSGDRDDIKVFMNLDNWRTPPVAFEVRDEDNNVVTGVPRTVLYRQYLVNHEMGHALGWGHHDDGYPDPTVLCHPMMQQSRGTAVCRANPWIQRVQ
jgi:hypothetical protein